jgi:hypothetical protein
MTGPCLTCDAPDSFYDRLAVEGALAAVTVQLKTGRMCRACYDKARAELRLILDKLGGQSASA